MYLDHTFLFIIMCLILILGYFHLNENKSDLEQHTVIPKAEVMSFIHFEWNVLFISALFVLAVVC